MGLHHCIQLCTGSVPAAAAEPSVDGMMSTQLYLALCEGRNDEAMAMMAADDQIAGKPPITTQSRSGLQYIFFETRTSVPTGITC
jgi:hypothetical protein